MIRPDQTYHVHNRGNNRENILVEERNYQHFLKLYAKYIEPVGDTYAYCLLGNHFHFLVRIKTMEEQEGTHKGWKILKRHRESHTQEPKPAIRQPVQRVRKGDKQSI